MSKALVLGGGGPVGIAWESGLIAGLAQAGVDLGAADFILGTSAGSFVGARLALGDPAAELAAPILAEADRPRQAPAKSGDSLRPAGPDLTPLMKMMQEARSGARPAEAVRADIGAFALSAETVDEAAFIASFGRSFANLAEDAWPSQGFACTAVDAMTGAFQLWTKESGVGVTRAVASSCSVPGVYPPVTLQGRRYIDGGMRSSLNADMAKGHDLVILVQVRGGDSAGPAAEAMARQLDEEIAALTGSGAEVVLISPDAGSAAAMGINLMNFARRPDAVRAGLEQGRAEAARIAAVWN
ncbi:patatin-like phospholipase family protein [Phenylobacterium sp.]|uniref:patatin-like phospholipase family protein n=1 Tax=Phenylobacterium sp. TaxID=1871053 RepID=UPI00272EF97F|nr:patatin-like phospholipase family protein [Phenylobacterium sp.]MDP2214230.1 patatin-like phospholipase family protein [Phenylobacterium sp.]